jgi:hypothetical protein
MIPRKTGAGGVKKTDRPFGRNCHHKMIRIVSVHLPFPVIFPYPVFVLAAAYAVYPFPVFQIPINGAFKTFLKTYRPFPPEPVLYSGTVNGVTPVMSGPVFDIGNCRSDFFGIRVCLFGNNINKTLKQFDVFLFVFPAYVVLCPCPALLHDGPNGDIVIFHI